MKDRSNLNKCKLSWMLGRGRVITLGHLKFTCNWCWWWWYIPGGVGLSGCVCLCRLLDCWPPRDELRSSGSLLTPTMPPLEAPSCRRGCGLSGSGRPPCRLWLGLWDCWLYWRKWCSSPPPAPSPPSMRFVEAEPEPGASCTSSFWLITPLQQSVKNWPSVIAPLPVTEIDIDPHRVLRTRDEFALCISRSIQRTHCYRLPFIGFTMWPIRAHSFLIDTSHSAKKIGFVTLMRYYGEWCRRIIFFFYTSNRIETSSKFQW